MDKAVCFHHNSYTFFFHFLHFPCTIFLNFHLSIFQTLLNAQGLYAASVLPAYLILSASVALAFVCAGGNVKKLDACFKPVLKKAEGQRTVEVQS
jgi:hypothetical protein